MKPRRALALWAVILALVLAPAGPAAAMDWGLDDREQHPAVALVSDFNRHCAGVALSPLAVLTSASCFTENGTRVWVSFDDQAQTPQKPTLYPGVWIVHDDTCLGCPARSPGRGPEIAVVILDEAVQLRRYATLPQAGDWQALAPGLRLDVVGYRVERLALNAGLLEADFGRMFARTRLAAGRAGRAGDYLELVALPEPQGGCFTSAGSPALAADGHTVFGVVSAAIPGDCRKTAAAFRLDGRPAQDFIQEAIQDPYGLKSRHDFK